MRRLTAEAKAKAAKASQQRSMSQPCRGHPPARNTQARTAQPKRASNAKPVRKAEPKPAPPRSSSKARVKDVSTQTAEKPCNQKQGKVDASRARKCGKAPPRSAQPKTPRGRGPRAGSAIGARASRPRTTRPCKMNRSFSAPTISATQKSKAADALRRSQSAGPLCHRRCVACLVAELRSMSWPPLRPGTCVCSARRRPSRKAESRSRSRRIEKTAENEKDAEKVLEPQELIPWSSPQELIALGQLMQLRQAACLDGAVQTDYCELAGPRPSSAQHHATNSEFKGIFAQQMPQIKDLSVSADSLDRRLPCIPLSWTCIHEFTRMRQFALTGMLPSPPSMAGQEIATSGNRTVATLTQVQ